jgi:hypothetical protein
MGGLKDYMFTYNLYQVVVNVWSIWMMVHEMRRASMRLFGNKVRNF